MGRCQPCTDAAEDEDRFCCVVRVLGESAGPCEPSGGFVQFTHALTQAALDVQYLSARYMRGQEAVGKVLEEKHRYVDVGMGDARKPMSSLTRHR